MVGEEGIEARLLGHLWGVGGPQGVVLLLLLLLAQEGKELLLHRIVGVHAMPTLQRHQPVEHRGKVQWNGLLQRVPLLRHLHAVGFQQVAAPVPPPHQQLSGPQLLVLLEEEEGTVVHGQGVRAERGDGRGRGGGWGKEGGGGGVQQHVLKRRLGERE